MVFKIKANTVKDTIKNSFIWKNKKYRAVFIIIIIMIPVLYVYLSIWNTFFAYSESLNNYINSDFSTEKILLKNGGIIKINNDDQDYHNTIYYSKGIINQSKDLELERFDSAIIELPDGKVFITGGRKRFPYPRDYTPKPKSSTEIYDPKTNTLEDGNYMTIPRFGHEATQLPDGKILISGGQKLNSNMEYSELYSTEIYDPVTKTFNEHIKMLTKHAYHDAVLTKNNKILITDKNIGMAELYDPEKKEFKLIKWFPISYQQKTISLPNKNALTVAIIENEDEDMRFMGRVELWEFDSDKEMFNKINSPQLESVKAARFTTAELLPNNKVLVKYAIHFPLPLTCGVVYDPNSKTTINAGCLPLKEMFK